MSWSLSKITDHQSATMDLGQYQIWSVIFDRNLQALNVFQISELLYTGRFLRQDECIPAENYLQVARESSLHGHVQCESLQFAHSF